MKISEEDLDKIFKDDNDSLKTEVKGDRIIVKKTKSTREISKVRKTLRRIPKARKRSDFTEFINSVLRFFAIVGFSGFILYVAMGWGGFSQQIKWGYYVNYLNKSVPAQNTPVAQAVVTRTPNDSVKLPAAMPQLASFPQNMLKIDKVGLNAPVAWNVEEDNIIEQLKSGVAHYKGTSLPGEGGNIFIVGHSSNYFWVSSDYNSVFALLDKLSPGDRIELSTNDKNYIYEVKSTNVVSPDEVQVLQNTEKETLSLMTCWPIGTSLKRLVVQSEYMFSTN